MVMGSVYLSIVKTRYDRDIAVVVEWGGVPTIAIVQVELVAAAEAQAVKIKL